MTRLDWNKAKRPGASPRVVFLRKRILAILIDWPGYHTGARIEERSGRVVYAARRT